MVKFLYQLARLLNDLSVLISGNPKRMVKRLKNKFIGRRLAKVWQYPR